MVDVSEMALRLFMRQRLRRGCDHLGPSLLEGLYDLHDVDGGTPVAVDARAVLVAGQRERRAVDSQKPSGLVNRIAVMRVFEGFDGLPADRGGDARPAPGRRLLGIGENGVGLLMLADRVLVQIADSAGVPLSASASPRLDVDALDRGWIGRFEHRDTLSSAAGDGLIPTPA